MVHGSTVLGLGFRIDPERLRERRAYDGGQGSLRQARRNARRDLWLQGQWKPKA